MDFSSLAFSGTTILAVVLAVIAGIILFTIFYHRKLDKQAMENLGNLHEKLGDKSVLETRSKYPEADVFQMRSTLLNAGLAISLLLTVLAFNWTTYDEDVFIPEDALAVPDDIEVEPPRTAEPPPPPPPPPPPVIEEVPDEEILEKDEPEFVDNSVNEETEVVKKPEAPKPPPPPPPPPPKVVEEMPRFPGCENESGDAKARDACAQKKMLEFIYKNIKYPAIARENGVEGTVVVTFVVEKDGSISDAKTLRDIGAQCGEEALRIVKMMPKWTAGKQRGNPVRVQFNLPVRFKLE